VTIHTDSPAGDLARLRIDRDAAPRRRWVLWAFLLFVCASAAAAYPKARDYIAQRRAPEVDVARATQVVAVQGDRPISPSSSPAAMSSRGTAATSA